MHAALVVVDMQNGFCHPEGSRAQLVGSEAAAPTIELVERVVALIELARRHGLPVWLTRQEYWPDDQLTSRRRIRTGIDRAGGSLDVCREQSWDAELVEEIERVRQPEDVVIVKHRSSAFYATPLEQQLRMRGIETLIVAGTTTSYCVESTVRDAHARDFDVIVAKDAVADTEADAQRASLRAIERFHGLVCSLDELPNLLHASTTGATVGRQAPD